jgi:bacterioferritin-associated ferredoxin
MIVCSCRAVSDHALREAARSGQSPDEILAATGAGSDCGHCRDALESILGTSSGPCA